MNFLKRIFNGGGLNKRSNGNSKKYKLSGLGPDLDQHIKNKLAEAEYLVIKYQGHLPENKFDASVLDDVLEKWRDSTETSKEEPAFVVEALGAAFGQDLTDTLDCEWQIWEDKQGKDLTVIHKKYVLNTFPFSSLEKAVVQNRKGSLDIIKSVLEKNIADAETKGEIEKR